MSDQFDAEEARRKTRKAMEKQEAKHQAFLEECKIRGLELILKKIKERAGEGDTNLMLMPVDQSPHVYLYGIEDPERMEDYKYVNLLMLHAATMPEVTSVLEQKGYRIEEPDSVYMLRWVRIYWSEEKPESVEKPTGSPSCCLGCLLEPLLAMVTIGLIILTMSCLAGARP